MKKTLYSLMLSEDVVRAVDERAHQLGLSRSGLVNQILAQSLSVATPESRINDIFQQMEALMAPVKELVPFFAPNSPTMSLKSSLAYKYRPTVKYEVELSRGGEGKLGDLSVVFRTQSAQLIADMTDFFRLWVGIENAHLAPLLGARLECALYEGKFLRPIPLPRSRNCSAQDIAQALSQYVQLFDRLLKGYLSGDLSPQDVEKAYCEDLKTRTLYL